MYTIRIRSEHFVKWNINQSKKIFNDKGVRGYESDLPDQETVKQVLNG